MPLGFDGSLTRKTGTFSWGFDYSYTVSGNAGTLYIAGTAVRDITASDGGGDIILDTFTDVKLPIGTVARGFIIDVTSGTNFGSLRIYQDGRISMNWNASLVSFKGHYIEGAVSFLIS